MTPAQCKTAKEASCAADAVHEARLAAFRELKRHLPTFRTLHEFVDAELYRLQNEYSKRADDLARKPKRAKGGGRKKR